MELLHQLFEAQADTNSNNIALVCDGNQFTYLEIEGFANQIAHWLLACGLQPGQRVALLLDRSVDLYISLLGTLKAGGAYVPIDPEFPHERIEYIIKDSQAQLLLTTQKFSNLSSMLETKVINLDEIKPLLHSLPITRVQPLAITSKSLCYIIYTSGTTGWPKGVAISHSAVCNYVLSALKIYGVTSEDHIYQGFSIAFDASIEEIWSAFASGATLVTSAHHTVKEGGSLVEFLNFYKITLFSTVPTMLAILKADVPSLKTLILGGEYCSHELICRWSRPGLRIFNTYGPSEATVIATYFECHPDKETTIGKPIPNVEVVILNENLQPVANGTHGELCIGGAGLAIEYVNQPEMTLKKFIADPRSPSKKLYRTGDQAYIKEDGDIQFLGRIDEQLKLRGFRIEILEIENAIRSFQEVRDVAVTVFEFESGMQALVAYVILQQNNYSTDSIKDALHKRLPNYMVPTLFEVVSNLPQLPSGKVDKKRLPKPTIHHNENDNEFVAPTSELEKKITSIWEATLKQSPISIRSNFFEELGGHSLAAAIVISAMRANPEMSTVSLVDIYENPTIEEIAKKIEATKDEVKKIEKDNEYSSTHKIQDKLRYGFCAFIQGIVATVLTAFSPWHFILIVLLWVSVLMALPTTSHLVFITWLIFFFLLEPFLMGFCILSKWLLLGKIKPGKYKLWGWFYLRWWIVTQLQSLARINYITGSPFMIIYLRLMGAKIGKNCHIGSNLTSAFDLLTVGDNSSLGNDVIASGCIVEKGWLRLGHINIGNECFIGANSVISINSKIGNRCRLGEHSLVPEGVSLKEDSSCEGSPLKDAKISLPETAHKNPSKLRIFALASSQYLFLVILGILLAIAMVPGIFLILYYCFVSHSLINCLWAVPVSGILYVLIVCLGLWVFGRILGSVKTGVYSIYCSDFLKVWCIERLSLLSLESLGQLFGTIYSSSWFRLLGSKIGKNTEISTVRSVLPSLLNIGDSCFIADSTILAPARIYQSAISVQPIHLGNKVFVGNSALVRANTTIGDNSLTACLSVSPFGEVSANTNWLGAPAMYLPQRQIYSGFSEKQTYQPPLKLKIFRGFLDAIKILFPSISMFFIITLSLLTITHFETHHTLLVTILTFPIYVSLFVVSVCFFVIALKWIIIGRYREMAKPMWTTHVLLSEFITGLYDNIIIFTLLMKLVGTPFIAVILRCLGTKIGKHCFINTPYFSEFDLVEIGDNVCINRNSTIQTHLYEDRVFKIAKIVVEDRCFVGERSIILYNGYMKNDSSLGNLSLLMKGEILYSYSYWEGIPAHCVVHCWV